MIQPFGPPEEPATPLPTPGTPSFERLPPALRLAVLLAAAIALLAGLYGRFKGLGTWPLGVDEFYIARSVDNILGTGLPGFPCGGYYNRGVLFQYLVAGLRSMGAGPEFAPRMIAVVASLGVLPAAYLLGRRLAGPLAGWLTVMILSLSMWEIEMARFGRMYAPFQLVFVWYAFYFLRYVIDRDDRALKWLAGLSMLGVLIWEGGVLLGLATILALVLVHERGRLRPAQWLRIAGAVLLARLLYQGTISLRGEVAAPPGAGPGHAVLDAHAVAAAHTPMFVLLVPAVLALLALPWIWSLRARWLTALGLFAVLTTAVLHRFTLSAGLLALLLLAALLGPEDVNDRHARSFWIALGGMAVYWACAVFIFHVGQPDVGHVNAGLAAQLLGFPDVYDAVIRPWGRTLPLLCASLSAALAYLVWLYWVRDESAAPAAGRGAAPALLALVCYLVLIIGAIPTNRVETRYTFFLYPVLIALAASAALDLRRLAVFRRLPLLTAAAVPLACFAASEDFQPRHIAAIDSPRTNFRSGMTPVMVAHYYPRNDVRAAAQWLQSHVEAGDVVVSGIPSLDAYYGKVDATFLDAGDRRYEDYACQDGRSDRWTNHPLLVGAAALDGYLAQRRRVLMMVYQEDEAEISAKARARGWEVKKAWSATQGNLDVLALNAAPADRGR